MTSICYNYNDANRKKIQSFPLKSFKHYTFFFGTPIVNGPKLKLLKLGYHLKCLQALPFQTKLITL